MKIEKARAFLDVRRATAPCRPVEERLKDFQAVELRLSDREVALQTARCMDCGTPFCHGYGCPLANVIPELNTLVYEGRWEQALNLLLSTNPFPEITGRICPALCEASCVLGAVTDPVAIRNIELEIIERAYERGYMRPRPPRARRTDKVAVIGSGPAGLAAADALNRLGFNVVVYENAAEPGGILRYGIPEFKLEKRILDRRIALMKEEGVVFETGVEAGKDVSLRFLRGRFKAIVLACGARQPRDIRVPGRDLSGILFAMQYLSMQNRILNRHGSVANAGGRDTAAVMNAQAGQKMFRANVEESESITAAGKRVLVLGGGDTGADCIGTALRQGAVHVEQWEIMPKPPETRQPDNPWPEWPRILRTSSSHKEGGERRWNVTVKEFLGRDGAVCGVKGVEVDWRREGAGSSSAPVEKPGSEFVASFELVLLALGYISPGPNPLADEMDLKRDARGFVARDRRNMTSAPGVFVAGDMTLGASLVVRAIADGIAAARGVAEWVEEGAPGTDRR